MSDRYYTFDNWKYGLDARKSNLTEIPGTLLQCINGFVNSGGEIEQRKSFAKDATQFPGTATFGLQDTDSGLVTFGSSDQSMSSFPTGVTYQRLQHPTGWQKVGGNIIPVVMVSVIYSCNYLGKAFVVAEFSDNSIFCFYNGSIVADTRNGLVLVTAGGVETIANLSTDLAAIVNTVSGWLADANVTSSGQGTTSYNETAANGSTLVMSPPNIHFTPVTSDLTAAGVMGTYLVDQNFPGVSGAAASAAFTLTGGASGSVTVTAPATSAGTGTAAVSGGAVNFNSSLNQTAADIATAINANTYLTGYSAINVPATAVVTVFAPIAWGNFTFNLTVTPVTITVGGGSSGQVSISLSPSIVNVLRTATRPATVAGSCVASLSGATGTPTFVWVECDANGHTPVTNASGIAISSTTAASVSFSKFLSLNTSVQGYFKCTGTDSGGTGTTASKVLSVILELDSNS